MMRSPLTSAAALGAAATLATLLLVVAAGCPGAVAREGEGETGEGEGEGEGAEGEGEGEGAEGEGEGEGAEGEGEGEGAEGEGEGEGEGGEGEGEGEGAPCSSNANCPLGEICPNPPATCVVGCTEARDCAGGLQCDTAVQPHGACVQCVLDGDCTGAGEVCRNDACVVACTDNTACAAGGQVCDVAAGHCVACLQDGDCALDNICVSESCVAGCHQDRDCQTTETCDLRAGDPGTCVVACTVTPDDCPLGTHCDGVTCQLGCGTDNTRCGNGDICSNNQCLQACSGQNNNCRNGDHCDTAAGVCAAGCAADTDCGQFSLTPVCDVASGQCVGCLAPADCSAIPNATCDTTVDECRGTCDPTQAQCFGPGGLAITGVCNPNGDICVECLADTDCRNAGDTCDLTTHTCNAPATTAGGLCSLCQRDADCGGTNQCIAHRENAGGQTENVCAQDCADGAACPAGFACEFVTDVDAQNGTVTGKQCVPSSTVIAFPTCDAFRDLEASAACTENQGARCGFDQPLAGDGVCLPPDANTQDGVCTIPCGVATDCPAGFVCDPVNFPNFPVADACVRQ